MPVLVLKPVLVLVLWVVFVLVPRLMLLLVLVVVTVLMLVSRVESEILVGHVPIQNRSLTICYMDQQQAGGRQRCLHGWRQGYQHAHQWTFAGRSATDFHSATP